MNTTTMYRRKPMLVRAVQWNKDGDHDDVEPRPATVAFDKHGHYFYVDRYDVATFGQFWMAVDPDGEYADKFGETLPFSMFSLKTGEQVPVADRPDLVNCYMAAMRWSKLPVDCGYIRRFADRPHSAGTIVHPGDWIVTEFTGERLVMKNDEFWMRHEKVEVLDEDGPI